MKNLTQVDEQHLEHLRGKLRGELLTDGDPGYDESRSLWNRMIDRSPGAIVKCVGPSDVIEAIQFARDNQILLSVKSGGHHVSGSAVCEGGLMLDLSSMNAIHVDPDAKTARVEAGATWGDVDHETQAFGLATVGGQDPNIGVGGLTLGGGVGWLSRKYGLTVDNLLEVDLVTAEGRLVKASESEHPDLFWALRGGGGNFGIATSFTYQLHEVGPQVLAGSLIYPMEKARSVASFYNAFMDQAPDELRTLFGLMVLPSVSSFPDEIHNERVAIVISMYAGDPADGVEVLSPLREFSEPIVDSIQTRSYTSFQRAGESPDQFRTYLRSQYVENLSEQAIGVIEAHTERAPSSDSTVFISHHGGAETRPAVDATAYPHRAEAFHVLIEARWDDPAQTDEHVEWVRRFHRALEPYTTGDVEMNFLTDDATEARVRRAYGSNYDRLVRIKNRWDSQNLFRMNQNIEPTTM